MDCETRVCVGEEWREADGVGLEVPAFQQSSGVGVHPKGGRWSWLHYEPGDWWRLPLLVSALAALWLVRKVLSSGHSDELDDRDPEQVDRILGRG